MKLSRRHKLLPGGPQCDSKLSLPPTPSRITIIAFHIVVSTITDFNSLGLGSWQLSVGRGKEPDERQEGEAGLVALLGPSCRLLEPPAAWRGAGQMQRPQPSGPQPRAPALISLHCHRWAAQGCKELPHRVPAGDTDWPSGCITLLWRSWSGPEGLLPCDLTGWAAASGKRPVSCHWHPGRTGPLPFPEAPVCVSSSGPTSGASPDLNRLALGGSLPSGFRPECLSGFIHIPTSTLTYLLNHE